MEADLAEVRRQKEVLFLERNSLLDSLKRTNEEFILLKKKRIQDVSELYYYAFMKLLLSWFSWTILTVRFTYLNNPCCFIC